MTEMSDALDTMADDLDDLMGFVMGHAEDVIRKRQIFYPFGAVMDLDGELEPVQVMPATPDADPAGALPALIDALHLQADDIRAAAIVTLTQHEGRDAVQVDLHHRDGLALRVWHLYQRRVFRRVAWSDAELMQPIEPTFWSPAAS